LVRKKAIGLREGQNASHIAASGTQSPSGAALESSSTRLAPEGFTAKRLVERDRRVRKESIAAHGKRQASNHTESVTPRKRARQQESSDSDTDAHWMTPRRYVRPSPEMSPRKGRQGIVVLIPPCNIDKSLYIPYVSPPPEEQAVVEPNLDASPCSPHQRRSNRSPAPEACRRQPLMAARRRLVSAIRDEPGNRSAERSVPSYG
jgi:hypothetical protein